MSAYSEPWLEHGALAEQEVISSLSWLVTLRWLIGLGVLLGTWLATVALGVPIPAVPLYLLGLGILAYNGVFWGVLHHLDVKPSPPIQAYQWLARIQIGVDWLAMATLVHFTGGIESPTLYFFLLHIIIASLLLPRDRWFLYVALAPSLVATVALLEASGLLSHVTVFQPARYRDPLFITVVLMSLTASSYATAYLSITISRRLRRREDQLAALYRSLRATSSTLHLPDVLDRLAEATTKALDCKAAAIRLLDRTGTVMEMAGSYGLSETYKDKAPIDVARARIDQQVLSGKTILVPKTTQEDRLRYPNKVIAEGIYSILNAPLVGRRGAIGVLRAYGGAGKEFTEDDAAFLGAIATQGAVAIENAQAYQLLANLDRDKSQFVRIVTHELRSPVSVATSALRVLGRGYVGNLNQEQADLVQRAQRRIEYLQSLIDDLLDLAAGKADLLANVGRGLVSLPDVVREVYTRFEPPAQAKGLALGLECPDRALMVWGDRGELDRMLNNLVSNALKYTPQGAVQMSLGQVNGAARIVVSDTGIGIPGDALPHLFHEFYRAQNARQVEESGTGLGLSIVKGLVDRYSGTIDVKSAEGQGTTFTLTLPLAGSPAA